MTLGVSDQDCWDVTMIGMIISSYVLEVYI